MENIFFGECPICRQGQLVAMKNSLTGKLLLMCDDCESQWLSPAEARSFENALSNEIQNVVTATAEEVNEQGWTS